MVCTLQAKLYTEVDRIDKYRLIFAPADKVDLIWKDIASTHINLLS